MLHDRISSNRILVIDLVVTRYVNAEGKSQISIIIITKISAGFYIP